MARWRILLLVLTFSLSNLLLAKSNTQGLVTMGGDYNIDMSPFETHPKLAAEYNVLQKKFTSQPLSLKEHQRRIEILNKILGDRPRWTDGYWLKAADTFFMSAELAYKKSYDRARSVINEGMKATQTCLQFESDNDLCRFFQAALIAKKASIDGILASLEYGEMLRDLWLELVKKNKNIVFQSNVTLLGSVHYALGLFYRLVPDFFLIDWLWDIRGDLDQSIYHHRQAVKYDPKNPCTNLMLAVSLFCKADGKKSTVEYKEALSYLDQARQSPAIDVAQQVCWQDVPQIRAKPNRTCGYTQAKYHEEASEEDLKKQQKKTKLESKK